MTTTSTNGRAERRLVSVTTGPLLDPAMSTPEPTRRSKRHIVRRAATVLSWVVVSVGAIGVLVPVLWMLGTSLRTEADLFADPARLWPNHPTFSAYQRVWSELPFVRLAINSVVFALGTTLLLLVFDSLAAYGLARTTFRGQKLVFWLVLATLMVPFNVTLIPTFQLINALGWLNTYQGLIVPRMASAFGIFMLRQFFLGIPRELDEAALIDGASRLRVYWSVALPLARPALATLFVLHFMNLWNDFLWPLVMSTDPKMRTLPAGLTLFAGQHVVDHAVVMAGAAISLAPLAIAFLVAQKYFVQGIATTGLK